MFELYELHYKKLFACVLAWVFPQVKSDRYRTFATLFYMCEPHPQHTYSRSFGAHSCLGSVARITCTSTYAQCQPPAMGAHTQLPRSLPLPALPAVSLGPPSCALRQRCAHVFSCTCRYSRFQQLSTWTVPWDRNPLMEPLRETPEPEATRPFPFTFTRPSNHYMLPHPEPDLSNAWIFGAPNYGSEGFPHHQKFMPY